MLDISRKTDELMEEDIFGIDKFLEENIPEIIEETSEEEEDPTKEDDSEDDEEENESSYERKKQSYEDEDEERPAYTDDEVKDSEYIDEDSRKHKHYNMITDEFRIIHDDYLDNFSIKNEYAFNGKEIENEIEKMEQTHDSQISFDNHDIYEEREPDIEIIKYDNPVNLDYSHNPVYQEITLKNNGKDNMTVYELTIKNNDVLGTKAERSEEFKSMYFTEINGIKDGENGLFWEIAIKDQKTGKWRVSDKPADKIDIDANTEVKWFLKSEEEGGCGGVIEESYGTKEVYRNNSLKRNSFKRNLLPPLPGDALLMYH